MKYLLEVFYYLHYLNVHLYYVIFRYNVFVLRPLKELMDFIKRCKIRVLFSLYSMCINLNDFDSIFRSDTIVTMTVSNCDFTVTTVF